jgi:hypothetical protein
MGAPFIARGTSVNTRVGAWTMGNHHIVEGLEKYSWSLPFGDNATECLCLVLPPVSDILCQYSGCWHVSTSFVQNTSLCCLLRQISWMWAKSQDRITNCACILYRTACKYGRVRLGHRGRGKTLHLPWRNWSRPWLKSGSVRLLTSDARVKSQKQFIWDLWWTKWQLRASDILCCFPFHQRYIL